MDLGTTGIIVGIVAAVVYVVETACKYGSALLKKRNLARAKTQVTGQPKKESSATIWPLKKISETRSRPISINDSPGLIRGSYSKTMKVRRTHAIDIATYYGSAILKKIAL